MKYSELFGKTSKQIPKDEFSLNSKLLIRAGYIDKVASGVYTFLPLGVRVLSKISKIVREEMNVIGGQELLMPVLHPKENWETTARWESMDVLFKLKGESGEFALGPTHEEIIAPLAKRFVFSYTDLPKYLYQIQTKFRDEPRAKSGILRGREFLMKDLYSFHADEEDLEKFYEIAKKAYERIFKSVGLKAIETEASGGTFAKFSHEYQVLNPNGEDTIYVCSDGHFSRNKEIIDDLKECPDCSKLLKEESATEVGNIFKLKTKFSDPFSLTYADEHGKQKPVLMGCYGIGISRVMGTIAEVSNDEKGIIWPKSVSPFDVHLVHIEDPGTESWVKETYETLTRSGLDVLWDDRVEVRAGEKFADADLIGIPVRLVVSKKVGKGNIEFKNRDENESEIIPTEQAVKKMSQSS